MSQRKTVLIILIILLVDQISKIYIKTHFLINEAISVFAWFKIAFVEYDGMPW